MARLWFDLKSALALGGAVALALGLTLTGSFGPATAAPLSTPALANHASVVEPARIYKRGRTPIYPYYYRRGRPGGWDFYMGFVPYAKGDYGTQAIQRSQYPQDMAWPPAMPVWPQRR
jgi:hypothetical protein